MQSSDLILCGGVVQLRASCAIQFSYRTFSIKNKSQLFVPFRSFHKWIRQYPAFGCGKFSLSQSKKIMMDTKSQANFIIFEWLKWMAKNETLKSDSVFNPLYKPKYDGINFVMKTSSNIESMPFSGKSSSLTTFSKRRQTPPHTTTFTRTINAFFIFIFLYLSISIPMNFLFFYTT